MLLCRARKLARHPSSEISPIGQSVRYYKLEINSIEFRRCGEQAHCAGWHEGCHSIYFLAHIEAELM